MKKWMDMARTPCPVYPEYGYMWWLNTDKKLWPHAPALSFAACPGEARSPTATVTLPVCRWQLSEYSPFPWSILSEGASGSVTTPSITV